MATCPNCNSSSRVLDSRHQPDGTTSRRRKCQDCGHRFRTIETLPGDQPSPAQPSTGLGPEVRQAIALAGLVLEWEAENASEISWRRECRQAAIALAEFSPPPALTWLQRDDPQRTNFNLRG